MRTFATFVLVLIAIHTSQSQTVSGPITSDTAWTTPVHVTGNVTVVIGHTLTIQPGVVVSFDASTSLFVAGAMSANGTGGSPITFTSNSGSPTPGSWNGIEFQNTTNVGSIFNDCIVQYAGGGSDAAGIFYITGAYAITISNSTFQFNAGNGVNTRASAPHIVSSTFNHNAGFGVFSDLLSNYTIDSCTVINNTIGGIRVSQNASSASITNSIVDTNGVGIYIDNSAFPTIKNNNIRRNAIGIQFTSVGSTQPLITGNTISGNTSFGFVNSGSSTVTAKRNYWGSDLGPFHASLNPTGTGNAVSDFVDFQPWSSNAASLPVIQITANIVSNTLWIPGTVYWVKNSITVNNLVILTINPGTIVKFAPSARLTVNGAIVANGKPDSLIVFTSEKDDGYGGDSNGDSTITSPSPGNWDMLYLTAGQNNSSVFNNCVIRFGGSSGYGNFLIQSTSPTFSNIYSTNSSLYGMYITGSNSNFTGSTFGGNGSRGMYLSSSNCTISNCIITRNGSVGVWADGPSHLSFHKTTVTNNGSTGIQVDNGTSSNATITLIDSCLIANNNGHGVYSWGGIGSQVFSYTRISGNQGTGVWSFNMNDTVHFLADTILGNRDEGLVTSRTTIINNVIQNNRYPIGLFGRVNATYSGNTLSGNQYNNAIALRINRTEESFTDTLKSVFPSGITSGTYVLIENSPGQGVSTGNQLVIQPGVILKIAASMYFNVFGTLIANGTHAQPIIFTSYRDASYGGKTNLASDTTSPAPNDWDYMQITGPSSVASVIRNCVFKFGGQNGIGNIYMSNQASLTTPIDSIVLRKSSSMGIRILNSLVTITNSEIDSNASYGMYIEGSSPRADVTVRNTTVQDNGATGMWAADFGTYREVSNCIIRRNNGHGILINIGTISQVFNGNFINHNNGHGVSDQSPTIPAVSLEFIGNTISDNTADGVFSTAARFIDNHIFHNRYPLGVFGHLGNIYVDNNGVDGNRFQNNLFNNAIALAGSSYAPLSDTLKNIFPDSITSKTYVVTENIQVSNGTTLVIQPGVKVKFQLSAPSYNDYKQFNIYGTLLAVGTPASPITFTSWRDSSVGGKTTLLTDFGSPAPGDWYFAAFRNGSVGSVIRNCQFKYGGRDGQETIYFESNLNGLVFSNNLVRKSFAAGIYLASTIFNIDSTTVDSCASYGIWVSDNLNNNLSLRNSRIAANGNVGVYGQGNANFSVVSNCVITGNNSVGLYIQNNTIPLSVIGNTVTNNASHGIYILARNDLKDTLLTIAGNKIRNNANTGLFSSRALVIDDSITGNRYAIGVTGQISLDGTSTNAGNFYQGGYFGGNQYNSVLLTEGNVFGRLGLSFPPNDTAHVVAVRGDLDVPTGTSLTIAPGTVIKFPKENGNGRFTVDGLLKSEGTNTNKIVFTSWKDDSYGGDSNADSNATVPGPGNWDMIFFTGNASSSSHLLQTIVRYGGSTSYGNMFMQNMSAPVDSSFFSFSSTNGFYLSNSSSPVTGCEIHHNPTGIYLDGSSNPVITHNNFHDNVNYGLNNATSNTINAQFNYWGATSGPFVNQGAPQNLPGTGNRIGINPGEVNYSNWLLTRSGVLLGDVSSNGAITAFDASLILQYLVGSMTLTSPQLTAADVSGDGSVSAFDASYILRFVVGSVSGFPGLGKVAVNPNIASSYELKAEKGDSPDEINLVLHLNSGSGVYAGELNVDFDESLLAFVAVKQTKVSDSLTVFSNYTKGKASLALAGIRPVTQDGDLIKIAFKVRNNSQLNWETSLHMSRFVLNEVNLTQSAKDVSVNMMTLKGIPISYSISQNYPNPFNPSTTIQYQLPATGQVDIRVYDMLGREVLMLMDQTQPAGYYAAQWNGRNAYGQAVASGVYLYRIQVTADGRQIYSSTKRMVLLK